MTNGDLNKHLTFDEWALDVTSADTGVYAFVPICGDAIVDGYTVIADRSPGPLTSVISERGIDHVNAWTQEHPHWRVDFGNTTDLANLYWTIRPNDNSPSKP